ncbi:hypothetical protein KY290_038038 [Solanum tuberosum]|uniref:Uncharacterized protein n=1 Tax=Solanum tuberosum TaxID=4113 RepID=A0ABQ7TXV2_SOLTU|nr:hypothetical protein KY284_034933 [Solanum tuberosum]KAH0638225.1 hypothetical protein KY289_038140 [Solanum tuberosum]KAH0640789.1 hypothetical protein KY285_037375 [Solanum tuberosum]KAH0739333.1 hypothetical protein KY290_038038 [Solanum tuberosum]
MERLIYTNSLPSKLHLKTFPRLPKLHFSSLLHVESRRPNSLSCKCLHQFSSSGSTPSSRFGDGHVGNLSTSKDLQDGSGSKPHLLNWVAEILSQQRKLEDLWQKVEDLWLRSQVQAPHHAKRSPVFKWRRVEGRAHYPPSLEGYDWSKGQDEATRTNSATLINESGLLAATQLAVRISNYQLLIPKDSQ